MKTRGVRRLRWHPVVAVLAASVILTGCPKRPEVSQAGTGAIGPAAAALPSPTPSAGVAPPPEPGVTKPTPPQEAAVPTAPTPATPAAPSQAAPSEAAPQTPAPPGAAPVVPVQPAPTPAPEPPPQAVAPPAAPPSQARAAEPGAKPAVEAPLLKDIFFDFDMATIRPDQRSALEENLAWLKANSGATITIEGHCDERGTPEYNIALGERRAKAVKDFLVAGGIEEARLPTVSYGEERPFVLGHDESAWRWNRRAHFIIAQR